MGEQEQQIRFYFGWLIRLVCRRDSLNLHSRYKNRLAKKLSLSVLFTRSGKPSFKWLRELHNMTDASLELAEDSNELLIQLESERDWPTLLSRTTPGTYLWILPERITDFADSESRIRRVKRPAKADEDAKVEAAVKRIKEEREVAAEVLVGNSAISERNPTVCVCVVWLFQSGKKGTGKAKDSVAVPSLDILIGPEKIVVVINMDYLGEIHLGLDPRIKLEKQISLDTLSQFELKESECALLSAALVLALRGGARRTETVTMVVADHDAMHLAILRAGNGVVPLAAVYAENERQVWGGKGPESLLLLQVSYKTRAEFV
jgi:hypothetical protein